LQFAFCNLPPSATVLALLSVVVSSSAPAADNPFASRYLSALKEAGVTPDTEGLAAYLRLHHPGSEQQEQYRKLLAQLSDDDFFKREDAMLKLLQTPVHAAGTLEAASNSEDPEVRWRARLILEQTSQPRNDLLYAAFVVIQDRKVTGLAEAVLGTVPLCHSDHLRLAMSRALEATVTRDDADLIRGRLTSADVHVRDAAASALGRVLGADARDDLLPLLADKQDVVRLTAAELLLRHGTPQALGTLGQLLDSEQLSVRNRAIQLLRASVPAKLPYSGYAPAEERQQQAEAWRKAIQDSLSGAKSAAAPLREEPAPRISIYSYRQNELLEADARGRVSSSEGVAGARDCRVLPNGHRLAAMYREKKVVEVNADGRTVWEVADLPGMPSAAERLAGGNTLVATIQGDLLEFGRDRRLLRQHRFQGQIRDIRPQPDGRLLLLTFQPGHVIELNEQHDEVWRSPQLEFPVSVCTLDDGHLLVALYQKGQLLRLDRNGTVAPFAATFNKPLQVRQLVDGRFLVLDLAGVHMVERSGEQVVTVREYQPAPAAAGAFKVVPRIGVP
jgi:HEAT repeat protein